jgi:hypothetical protein
VVVALVWVLVLGLPLALVFSTLPLAGVLVLLLVVGPSLSYHLYASSQPLGLPTVKHQLGFVL